MNKIYFIILVFTISPSFIFSMENIDSDLKKVFETIEAKIKNSQEEPLDITSITQKLISTNLVKEDIEKIKDLMQFESQGLVVLNKQLLLNHAISVHNETVGVGKQKLCQKVITLFLNLKNKKKLDVDEESDEYDSDYED